MSRSVSVPTGAAFVFYTHVEFEDAWEWDDFLESVRDMVKAKYPSFDDEDAWIDREDHVVLQNNLAQVTVSEYMGLVAIAVVPFEAHHWFTDEIARENLAAHWAAQVEDGFKAHLAKYFKHLVHVGTFSNGEAVFREVTA